MSIRLLIREHPQRAIALVSSGDKALIFHHTSDSNGNSNINSAYNPNPNANSLKSASRTSLDTPSSAPKCLVEFTTASTAALADYHSLSPLPVHGTLGLIAIGHDIFICVVTGATKVASVRPGENVEKIHGVEFYCLSSSEYDAGFGDVDPYELQDGAVGGARREPGVEHPCAELQKLLGNGSFYYSTDFDLTNRLQDRWVLFFCYIRL
jgi:hypothetical protein